MAGVDEAMRQSVKTKEFLGLFVGVNGFVRREGENSVPSILVLYSPTGTTDQKHRYHLGD